MNLFNFNRGSIICLLLMATAWPVVHAQHTALAIGNCSIAVNASDRAQVTINQYCDTNIEKLIHKLISKNEVQNKLVRILLADSESKSHQIRELYAAVQTVRKIASQANTSDENKRAAALLEQGDTRGAAQLLGRAALAARFKSADLYRQQAALLRTENVGLALQALQHALLIEPNDQSTLLNAGDLATISGDSEGAKKYYERSGYLAVKTRKVIYAFFENFRAFSTPFFECLNRCLMLEGALRNVVIVDFHVVPEG
jgi:Flp pilus assembly protein TadD